MPATHELQDDIQRHEGYLQSDPGNLPLQLSLGDLYHQAGRLDEAVACYEQCLAQVPGHPPARSRLASVMITQHRFADAENVLRELLAQGGPDAALLHNLGLTLYYQQRWDEARECFTAATRDGLQAPSNLAYLTRSLHHLGNMPDAIEAGRQWVAQAQDSKSKSYLALLYLDNNETENGRKLAVEVLAENPDDTDANIVNGIALTEQQEMAQARQHFQTALRQDPNNGRAWLGLGLAHLYEQEHPQAIEALGNAVRIYPDNPGMIVALGWAQLTAKDPAASEQTFRRAVEVDRNFGESHGGLASALAMQNKLAEAGEEIKVAKRLDRRGFGAEFARSAILAIQGDQQAATSALTRLLQHSAPNSIVPLMEHLRIYSAKKGPPVRPQLPTDATKH